MNKKGLFARNLVIILIAFFAVTGCKTWYGFWQKDSKFYNNQEKVILKKSLDSVEYKSGFDQEMELDFVYAIRSESMDLSNKTEVLKKSLNSFKNENLFSLYKKIYYLKLKTIYEMEEYEKGEDWQEYTYVKKYYLPPLQQYSFAFEKALILKDKTFADKIKNFKKKKTELSDFSE